MLNIRDNIAEFERGLSDMARRQIPFAVSQALNDTIRDVDAAWGDHLRKTLDRPTPFTLKGTYLRRSSRSKLVATVGFKPVQAGYLALQQTGGQRMPKGRALVLPVGVRLNQYGNMPRGAVSKAAKRKGVFSGRVKGIGGIWKRPTSKGRKAGAPLQLLVGFKAKAAYKRRLDLDRVAMDRARATFPGHFRTRFLAALASAR